jgi:hypothetical protein
MAGPTPCWLRLCPVTQFPLQVETNCWESRSTEHILPKETLVLWICKECCCIGASQRTDFSADGWGLLHFGHPLWWWMVAVLHSTFHYFNKLHLTMLLLFNHTSDGQVPTINTLKNLGLFLPLFRNLLREGVCNASLETSLSFCIRSFLFPATPYQFWISIFILSYSFTLRNL